METWKDIPGYEGYQASDRGRIRSIDRYVNGKMGSKRKIPGIIRREQITTDGYARVVLSLGKQGIHRCCGVHSLVLLAFVGICPPEHQGHHRDHNQANNRLSNLRYVTPKENTQYSIEHGTHVNPKSPLIPVTQYSFDGKFIRQYKSGREAMAITGIDNRHICCACKGKYRTAGGFVWRYSS